MKSEEEMRYVAFTLYQLMLLKVRRLRGNTYFTPITISNPAAIVCALFVAIPALFTRYFISFHRTTYAFHRDIGFILLYLFERTENVKSTLVLQKCLHCSVDILKIRQVQR
jgi:hypothetical protein